MERVMDIRIGSTSYVYHDKLMGNVRRLAGEVEDIQVFLFDDPPPGNIPGAAQTQEMLSLAGQHRFTYTVHLPPAACLPDDDPVVRRKDLDACIRIARSAAKISPFAYTVHLQRSVPFVNVTEDEWIRWEEYSCETISELKKACDPVPLTLENVEGCPVERLASVAGKTGTRLCIDIGHLWIDGIDPVPILRRWGPLASILHIHGTKPSDHIGLSEMDKDLVDDAIEAVWECGFSGVLTIEVFSPEDYFPSRNLIQHRRSRT
jgi:sugar phosphate isomerase/epimerase